MSDRPIQRYTGNVPAAQQGASIMTPQGPATIQIIDMPSGALGPANPVGAGRKKPGGINVVGAVMRRWWLVLSVFIIVGGAAWFAGANLVKPSFEGRAKVSYQDANTTSTGGGLAYSTMHRAILLMSGREIASYAWSRPEMATLFPKIGGRDLTNPVELNSLLSMVKDFVDTDEATKGTSVVDVISLQATPEQARVSANAYAEALVSYCTIAVHASSENQLATLQKELKEGKALLKALVMQESKLKLDNQFEINQHRMANNFEAIKKLQEEKTKASVDAQMAKASVERAKLGNNRTAFQDKERIKFIEDETAKDTLRLAYLSLLASNVAERSRLLQGDMKEEHPAVVAVDRTIAHQQAAILARENEIKDILNKRIAEKQNLDAKDTLEQATAKLQAAEAQLAVYTASEAQLSKEQQRFAAIQTQVLLLENEANGVSQQNDQINAALVEATRETFKMPTALFKVEQTASPILKEDKRIKVQAGGLVGGLFLGILLALLVDKFDKRLRDPRDIEPLFGATLLGTIPRIQELKRIKGEQARNLIAEEFRIIRTQVLFGNPSLTQKLIAVTSPNPGDGKTSLSVNLAISIAKAGRRVLLIDGDLRKPDVHRVFNISDAPGFAELIQGSHEPGAVIKKSEVDGLEIMPAGNPSTRPSELLSRPEVGRLLLALSDLYDHIVMDTAPLLPVSDTHVLAGMMDGVIVSFNAEVDRDTIAMTQEILRRSRANIIGSVMNQVKYRQSGSYHRGKTAYDSYYNSPRGAAQAAKSDKLATVGKV